MAARVADSVIDNGLSSLKSAARYIYINSTEPTTYTEASSTYKLGTKDLGAGSVFPAAIAAGTNGRKVTTAAVTDGTVDANGTAAYWSITDASALLANGSLSASQAVTSGNTWSLAAFDITIKYQ